MIITTTLGDLPMGKHRKGGQARKPALLPVEDRDAVGARLAADLAQAKAEHEAVAYRFNRGQATPAELQRAMLKAFGLGRALERYERIEAGRMAEARAKAEADADRGGDIEIGTAERERKDRAVMVQTMEVDPKTGRQEVRTVGRRAAHAIDRLYDAGLLRCPGRCRATCEEGCEQDAARRRHEAGTWLLNLWDKCGFDTATICAYGRATGRGEMSDEADERLTWNRACWRDTMAATNHSHVLRALVMEDNLQRFTSEVIRAALDALADHRGM